HRIPPPRRLRALRPDRGPPAHRPLPPDSPSLQARQSPCDRRRALWQGRAQQTFPRAVRSLPLGFARSGAGFRSPRNRREAADRRAAAGGSRGAAAGDRNGSFRVRSSTPMTTQTLPGGDPTFHRRGGTLPSPATDRLYGFSLTGLDSINGLNQID